MKTFINSVWEFVTDINFPSSNDINIKIRKNLKRIKALCSAE
jgi:hypothetical protein